VRERERERDRDRERERERSKQITRKEKNRIEQKKEIV
jgi:hypothetical protein